MAATELPLSIGRRREKMPAQISEAAFIKWSGRKNRGMGRSFHAVSPLIRKMCARRRKRSSTRKAR
jgi:hypothetical protein